jgi:hypothetical protein
MAKYTVTWSIDVDCEGVAEANHAGFIQMLGIAANPHLGDNRFTITEQSTGENVEVDVLDGTLEIEPLLVAQIVGFRHLIWVGQSQARK